MEVPPEKLGTELLKDLERHKTPECLSLSVLGEYIEHKLPSQERDGAEKHLQSCLYCLNQLVELRELLFLEKKADPLPPHLENSLRRLAAKQNPGAWIAVVEGYKTFASSTESAKRSSAPNNSSSLASEITADAGRKEAVSGAATVLPSLRTTMP